EDTSLTENLRILGLLYHTFAVLKRKRRAIQHRSPFPAFLKISQRFAAAAACKKLKKDAKHLF
ncbi:MAG: hypothetical protein IJF15_00940, partial [Oscillospiraceae bacterium]|nr:hypothetical protein [Oscillospiraceae bacterium]